MQNTKSAAKKQQLREELMRLEQQIQSEKALRKKWELEKAAKVREQPFLLFVFVLYWLTQISSVLILGASSDRIQPPCLKIQTN